MSVSKGTLKISVAPDADRFSWFLSLIPRHILPRIGFLKVVFRLKCCESTDGIDSWLHHLDSLQLDTLTLGFKLSIGPHPWGRIHIEGGLQDAFEDSWRGREVDSIIDPLKKGLVKQIKFRFYNAPPELLQYLESGKHCRHFLGFGFKPAVTKGHLSPKVFVLTPIDDKGQIVLKRAGDLIGQVA